MYSYFIDEKQGTDQDVSVLGTFNVAKKKYLFATKKN